MSSANSAPGSSGAHTARTASSGRDPGRPRILDPAVIGAGVLRIGIDRLTFARAARELGVSQATLYRYAPDRDALIRFGLDAGIDAFDIPPLTGDWEPLLRSWAFAAWDLLATMPGAAGAIGRGVVSPALIEQFGRVTAALAARGFTAGDAALAADLVFDLVVSHRHGAEVLDQAEQSKQSTQLEQSNPTPSADDSVPVSRAEFRDEWTAAAGSGTPMDALVDADPRDILVRKLDIVLRGLAGLAQAEPAQPGLAQKEDRS